MRIFKKYNKASSEPCPICNTKDETEVVLIVKAGTTEGYNAEAIQVHLDCLELTYDKEHDLIYQKT